MCYTPSTQFIHFSASTTRTWQKWQFTTFCSEGGGVQLLQGKARQSKLRDFWQYIFVLQAIFLSFLSHSCANENPAKVKFLVFPGDFVIASFDCTSLQSKVDLIGTWCNKWEMSLNVQKCAHVTFLRKRVFQTCTSPS